MNELIKRLCYSQFQDEELYHHGITGMHWGVKNGPPYPLDKKVSAGIKSGKNKKVRYSDEEYRAMRSGKIKTNAEDKTKRTHIYAGFKGTPTNEHHYREGNDFTGFRELTSQGITGDIITDVATLIASGYGNWTRRLNRPGHKATLADVLDCNWQRQNSDSTHNGRNDPGLNNNCGKCAATMFLRGLGYDVQAGRSGVGVLNSAYQYWFDGARAYKETGARNMYERMLRFGNQGKGVLNIRHANGSGHSVYFQNERGNDGRMRPTIYDGQIGTRYGSLSDFLRQESVDITRPVEITRLDGTTPNWEHLAEDSVIRMNFASDNRNLVLNTRKEQIANYANKFRFN